MPKTNPSLTCVCCSADHNLTNTRALCRNCNKSRCRPSTKLVKCNSASKRLFITSPRRRCRHCNLTSHKSRDHVKWHKANPKPRVIYTGKKGLPANSKYLPPPPPIPVPVSARAKPTVIKAKDKQPAAIPVPVSARAKPTVIKVKNKQPVTPTTTTYRQVVNQGNNNCNITTTVVGLDYKGKHWDIRKRQLVSNSKHVTSNGEFV